MSYDNILANNPRYGHAPLSPSNPNWVNDTPSKFESRMKNIRAKERGTDMHLAAQLLINNKVSRETDPIFYEYVEDAIRLQMETEKKLTMSDNIYGTADAIIFNPQTMDVHIFDLKSGESGKMLQLEEYLAIFVYQYGQLYRFGPYDIHAELRMYKPTGVEVKCPTGEEIAELLNKMVEKDNWANEIKAGGTLLCNMLII